MQNVHFGPPAAPGPPKTRILATTCAQGAELGASCVRRGGGIGAPRRWIEIRCSSTSKVVTVVMLVVRRMVMTVTGASKAPKACKK